LSVRHRALEAPCGPQRTGPVDLALPGQPDLHPAEGFFSVVTDVGDPAAVARLFAAVADGLGPVDVLVNCAGHGGHATPTAEVTDDGR